MAAPNHTRNYILLYIAQWSGVGAVEPWRGQRREASGHWSLAPFCLGTGGCAEHWRVQRRGGRAHRLEHLPRRLRGPLAYWGGASPGSVNMKVFLW